MKNNIKEVKVKNELSEFISKIYFNVKFEIKNKIKIGHILEKKNYKNTNCGDDLEINYLEDKKNKFIKFSTDGCMFVVFISEILCREFNEKSLKIKEIIKFNKYLFLLITSSNKKKLKKIKNHLTIKNKKILILENIKKIIPERANCLIFTLNSFLNFCQGIKK